MSVKKLLFKSSFLLLIFLFTTSCSKFVVYEISSTAQKNKNVENLHKRTMNPYKEFGKDYYPKIVPIGSKFSGVASWYGPNFHGERTSSSEVYDMYKLSAAHKTLPMNTTIKVTNKDTNQSIILRVNDRGPFIDGRIVDLSYMAGKKIGLDISGVAPVELEVLSYDYFIKNSLKKSQQIKTKKSVEVFYVQIGSFKNEDSANRVKKNIAFLYEDKEIKIKNINFDKNPIYKVYIGDFKNRAEAKKFIKQNTITEAFVTSVIRRWDE